MSNAFNTACRCLAIREHGARELLDKLQQKGYNNAESMAALQQCQRLGLQSDSRFVEGFCHARIRQGYGPHRIMRDLHKVNIPKELIVDVFLQQRPDWLQCAKDVLLKKYRHLANYSYHDMQKQKQFLRYRGFAVDTISQVFKELINAE